MTSTATDVPAVRWWTAGEPIGQGSLTAVVNPATGRAVMLQGRQNAHEKRRAFTRWRNALALDGNAAMREARLGTFTVPVAVDLVFYVTRLKSVRRPLPSVKPDVDKLARAVLDAIGGRKTLPAGLWPVIADDGLVVDLTVAKRYATPSAVPGQLFAPWAGPGVSVAVREVLP